MVDKYLYTVSKSLQYQDITKVIYTDVSMHGWGLSTGGSWINTEKSWHINALELKSILLSLMSIVKDHGVHVKVFLRYHYCHIIHQQIGHIPLRIVPSYCKANLGMCREKRHTYYSCPYTRS